MFTLTKLEKSPTKLQASKELTRLLVIVLSLTFFALAPQAVRAATYTVTNTADSGPGSLRRAIAQANANPGPDTIKFNILPTGGVKTIFVQSGLPEIRDTVTINGWSQGGSGYEGPPLIELRGGASDGLVTNENPGTQTTATTIIRGLIINGFNHAGIHVIAQPVIIQGCYIGTTADGNWALPNSDGIRVESVFGESVVIGGNNARDRNVISGNEFYGVWKYGSALSTTIIKGNYIGLSASGAQPVSNLIGVQIQDTPGSSTRIGGNSPGERNVISGNYDFGIEVAQASYVRILGNFIGTDPNGVSPRGNGHAGIFLVASLNNFILSNVISGNGEEGILLAQTSSTKIHNNLIGVGADRTTPLGNQRDGISVIEGGGFNEIGGSTDRHRQILDTEDNVIAFNGRNGVSISSNQNLVAVNSIHDNGALGIDLWPDGVTPNDACDADFGANDLQNFPLIQSATSAGDKIKIKGTLNSYGGYVYHLEFYANRSCDSSSNGEGERFLGSKSVAVPLNECQVNFETTFQNITLPPGTAITATATLQVEQFLVDTSELSPCVFLTPAGGDTTPPTVTLAANPTSGTFPFSTQLTATASDDVVVVKVEFYRGATLVNTDSSPDDGFTTNVSFTAADVGTVSFTAKAYDTAGNVGSSNIVNVVVNSAAPPPTGVTASDGTYDSHVLVSWNASQGATAYRVYRDGIRVAEITTTLFQDSGAATPPAPGAPNNFSATDGTSSDFVRLTWNSPAPGLAMAHTYTVTALNSSAESGPSESDSGYRAAQATGYEITRNDGASWEDVGAATSFEDGTAPAGTLITGTATASKGTSTSHVSLSLVDATPLDGEPVSYRVRAKSPVGPGTASIADTGYRGSGALAYQWQASSIENDPFPADLAGATSAIYDDTTAPANGTWRWYRCRVMAGTAGAVSNWDYGFRLTSGGFAQVKAWGNTASGQLGVGLGTADSPQPSPVTMSNSGDITAISGGVAFTIFLKADGTLLAAGENYGISPVPVSGLSNVDAISAGNNSSLALLSDGTVKSTGSLETIPGLSHIVAIEAGISHWLALRSDGSIWAWGSNDSGQLGDSTTEPRFTPVRVGADVAGFNNIIAIGAGGSHSIALKSDGTVWVWGNNTNGAVGNGTAGGNQLVPVQNTFLSGVSQISAGQLFNVALKTDGTVWSWGANYRGNIGNGTTTTTGCFCVTTPQQSLIANIVDIKTASTHTLAKKSDGSIWAWGLNQFGEIGIGFTDLNSGCECQPTPVQSLVGTGNAVFGLGYQHSFSAMPRITTPAGNDVVLRGDALNLRFASVTEGVTSYTEIAPTSTGLDPGSFSIVPNSPAYNVTTSAVSSGNIDVCLKVPTEYNETNFNLLAVLHGEGANLVDRTLSHDYLKREICAQVTSLSPFVLAQAPAGNPGTLQFRTSTPFIDEASGTATVTVTRTGGIGGAGSVNYATNNGSAVGGASCGAGADFISTSGTLTWANGDAANKTFTIAICNDNIDEDGETISLTLNNPTGATTLGNPSATMLTIDDDDEQPEISVSDVSLAEGNAGTTAFTFNVSLSHASAHEVTVFYYTADEEALDSSDYQYQEGTLTFAPGETVKPVSILVNGDTNIEPDETFLLTLNGPTNATIVDYDGVGTILDDDDSLSSFSIMRLLFTDETHPLQRLKLKTSKNGSWWCAGGVVVIRTKLST